MTTRNKKSRKRTALYQAPDEQKRLFPDISGNTINGLGEQRPRQPTPVYWHHAKQQAHGALQDWMVENYNKNPLLKNIFRRGDRGPRELEPIAATVTSEAPERLSAALKQYALNNEADLVGITRYRQEWTFDNHPPITARWVIILGLEMDHELLSTAPEAPAAKEVADQYNRGVRAAKHLANWIHDKGYPAQAHGGPWAGPFTMIPAALECGFGELGKHGSIINNTYGSSFRLAAVLTDLPLLADEATRFGADQFCSGCRVCVDACPPAAIYEEKQLVRGEIKWYVDFDKCIPYFNETYGCAICLAVCPWSTPGRAPKLAQKWAKRISSKPRRTTL